MRLNVLLTILSLGLISPAHASPNLGDMAPEFTLMNQHKQDIALKDYRDQWVVLYFYPKNDTPGCTTEACSFRDNINKLIEKKAVILGVSIDSVDSHEAFAKKYQLPFSLLADPDGTVAKQYGALTDLKFFKWASRHSFIINPEGKIAKRYLNVDPQQHVKEVLDDLSALQRP